MNKEDKLPEVLYINIYAMYGELDDRWGAKFCSDNKELMPYKGVDSTPYILKSKYDELLKEKEELEKENEWISVEDELRLPDIGYKNQIQLFAKREFQPDFEVLQGWREKYGFCCSSMREDEYLKVTHWKPLPKAPIIKPTEK